MLGIIFTNLVEMIETEISAEMADEILDEAELSTDGAYTSVGHYPFEDVLAIVTLLSEKTDTPIPDLIFAFGQYLFPKLVAGHQHILPENVNLMDLLGQLDSNIHVEVLKLYPNATLPTFTILEQTTDNIVLEYGSPRQLDTLAAGLITGGSQYFDVDIDIAMTPLSDKPYRVKIDVKIREKAVN